MTVLYGSSMMRRLHVRETKGITLTELLFVIAIVGLLAAFAIPLFQKFLKKAQAIEGETALQEIKRLEETYYIQNLEYSKDLPIIGFLPSAPLKYYTIVIQLNGVGPPPFSYQATATGNLDHDPDLDAWVLTKYPDGTSDLKHGCIPGGVGAVQFNCTD